MNVRKRLLSTPSLLLIFSLSLAACAPRGEGDGAPDDLQEARERWAQQALADYTFVYERICFCIPFGKVAITVQDGEVVGSRVLETDEPLPAYELEHVPTIDELFGIIEEAQAQNAHQLEVTYHADGYPAQVVIDYAQNVADDEITYFVENVSRL